MTATAARIGFVTQEFRTVVASDAAVKTKYGSKARDTGEDVIESFFDDTADAEIMAAERLALLSPDRRRFLLDVNETLSFTGDLDFTQSTPAVNVIDDERSADHDAAIVEIGVDFGKYATTLVTWG